MSLHVHKYGGTSVGTAEKIQNVAKKLVKERQASGHDLVVVVSAMSGETNRMTELANQMQQLPSKKQMDVLLSTGEQVTIALLCMALEELGMQAVSYTGWQVKILTDDSHGKARIEEIQTDKIQADLEAKKNSRCSGFSRRHVRWCDNNLGPWRLRYHSSCFSRCFKSRRMQNLHRC